MANLEVTRLYKNASDDTLRIDTIYMERTTNSFNSGIGASTYYRRLSTTFVVQSNISDRDVAYIQLITTADEIDTTYYDYVRWNTNRAHPINCNMSDLPNVGDTL
jgi:hypothetical protein